MRFFQRTIGAKFVAIAYNFNPWGGSCVSINHYCSTCDERGGYVEKLEISERGAFLKSLISVLLGRKLVFNGLKCFDCNIAIVMIWLRRDSIIYLQESEVALNDYKLMHPVRYRLFCHLVKSRKIACISSVQEKHLRDYYRTQRTQLVYNTLPLIQREPFSTGGVKILMVGFIMPRKGVDLYSKLADFAKARGEDWQFYWIGGGHAPNLYFSMNVRWMGYQAHPRDYYPLIDLFFLSSVDEPMGMVCAEALVHNKRCVTYSNAGYSELIRGISGCHVYDEYTVESAYAAIRRALSEPLDCDAVKAMLKKTSGVEEFIQRFDSFLNEPGGGSEKVNHF